MTDTARIDELWQAVGMPRLSSPRLTRKEWEAAAPWPSNVSGDYNLADWMRLNTNIVADQRAMIDTLTAQVAALAAKVSSLSATTTNSPPVSNPVVVTPPAPVGPYGPIDAMTAAEISACANELQRGVGIKLDQTLVTSIANGLAQGIYPVVTPSAIDTVKDWYYNGGNKSAIQPYLAAVDQRDLVTNALLAPNDARVVKVSGIASGTASGPASAPVPSGSPQVVYTESVVMVHPETGFTIWAGISKNDDGLSVLYNYQYPWNNGATSDPKRPQMLIRAEQDGGVSVNGTAPQQKADGSPVERTPFDGLKGKDLIFYPNGYNRDGMGKSEFVDIACMQASRKLRFGASPVTAEPQFPLVISPDGVTVNGRPL